MQFKESLKPTWRKVISTSALFIFLVVYTYAKTTCVVLECTDPGGCCPPLGLYQKSLIISTMIIPIVYYLFVSYYEYKKK